MRTATLGALAAAVPGARLTGDPETRISDVVYNSQLVQPGALFAALRGSDHDGHAFVGDAINNGAAALLVEEAQASDVPQIVVEGAASRAALAMVSAEFYGHPSHELTVIGVTGTDGKTTTTAMLQSILSGTGHQTGTIGTIGIRIGNGTEYDLGHQTTPESNLVQRYLREMVTAGTTHVIIEATSHGLATHRLDGVRFLAGGVTNITHEHLDFHKTIEHYRRSKAILLERIAMYQGVVAINNDDEGARSVIQWAEGGDIVTYSASGRQAELRAVAIDTVSMGLSFDVVVSNDDVAAEVELPMLGAFNVANALCALAVAQGIGVPIQQAARALSAAKPVRGRMQRVDIGQPFYVVVDYAHTPESIRMILQLLREQYPDGRLIVVTGSAGERDELKRPLQGGACAEIADVTIVTSEDPRHEDPEAINEEIVAGAVAAGAVRGESVISIIDRREAIQYAFELAMPGDCVLLAGKGHETSIIWGREHVPWDESAVATALLRGMFAD